MVIEVSIFPTTPMSVSGAPGGGKEQQAKILSEASQGGHSQESAATAALHRGAKRRASRESLRGSLSASRRGSISASRSLLQGGPSQRGSFKGPSAAESGRSIVNRVRALGRELLDSNSCCVVSCQVLASEYVLILM